MKLFYFKGRYSGQVARVHAKTLVRSSVLKPFFTLNVR